MIVTKTLGVLAPGIGSRVIVFYNDASIEPYVLVENKGDSLSAGIEIQESDNGTSWTTVLGSTRSIMPGQSAGQTVLSSKRLLAIFAQGNTSIEVSVARNYNYSGSPNID